MPVSRLISVEDVEELLALRLANEVFLAPWEPSPPAGAAPTLDHLREVVEDLLRAYEQGTVLPHVIVEDGQIVGRVTLSNIVRAAFQSCNLGYWVAEAHNGRGLATAAVAEMCELAFGELRLHRIEAGTLLSNRRSQRVLARNGFVPFGLARKYLNIAGHWQDHLLFQRLAPESPLSEPSRVADESPSAPGRKPSGEPDHPSGLGDAPAVLISDAVHALVVVDMQMGSVQGPTAIPSAAAVIDAVEVLLERARRAGALIIYLRNAGAPSSLEEPGASGWQLFHQPAEGEIVIDKSVDDGFQNTDLADHLQRRGVERLAICGVMSEMCVATTARAALARGYGVVLAHDAHGTHDVPAGPGGSAFVPAEFAARAAEFSMGDTVEIVPQAESVTFAIPGPSEAPCGEGSGGKR